MECDYHEVQAARRALDLELRLRINDLIAFVDN